jgi:GTPase SAR1 family protein
MLKFFNNLILMKSINICVLGDPRSGKTSLINCYLKKSFEEKTNETIINITKAEARIGTTNFEINFL